MERIMKAQTFANTDDATHLHSKKTMEINPRHPLIRSLAAKVETQGDITEAAGTLLDLARVQDGDTPRDPVAFAQKMAAALAVA